METARMISKSTAPTKFPLSPNDTDNLDDTLPVELLDCVNTTTNNDWLTRDTPFPGKHCSAPKLYSSEGGSSSLFNPPLSSTRYKSDGSSSEFSDISTTAEFGSSSCDDIKVLSAGSPGAIISPLLSTASVEYQPLRCSADMTTDEMLRVNGNTFEIRVDTNEFKSLRGDPQVDMSQNNFISNPLRNSTGLVNQDTAVKSKAVQRNESLEFNPLRCSTGLVNQDTAVKSKAFQRHESLEFNPLRNSTGLVNQDTAVKSKAVQRNESLEFNPLRCSTGLVNQDTAVKSKAVQRNESFDFNPLRCSTGLVNNQDAALKPKAFEGPESVALTLSRSKGLKTEEFHENPVQIRPAIPNEFYVTASSTFNSGTNQSTVQGSDTHFFTALCSTQANSTGRKSTESAKSPNVEVSDSHLSAAQNADKLDDDLSILMQCHLKIRNGRHLVSNLQAKPHIELSVFKNSPIGTGTAVIPKTFSTDDQQEKRCQKAQNKLHNKPTGGKIHLKSSENEGTNFSSSSAIPTLINLPGRNDVLRDDLILGNAPNILDDRRSLDVRNGSRVQRAMDNLASSSIQKVIPALALLDSMRSAFVCETLVQRGLVDNVYDFLSKMNRSLAHQIACVHATSLLLDLAKHSYSSETVWQNGGRIGLLFNLMLIWASKDNAIFLNCASVLWVFSQDKLHSKVLQHFVASQNKLLEKISSKLGTKIQRSIGKAPTCKPSWIDLGAPRTYESPGSAFCGLTTALKLPTRA